MFNSLSIPRRDLVRVPAAGEALDVIGDGQRPPAQVVREENQDWLCFVSPVLDGFACRTWELANASEAEATADRLTTTANTVESPYYRLAVDPVSGGVASLVHKASGCELVTPDQSRTLCQTVFDDGQEHTLKEVTAAVWRTDPSLHGWRSRVRSIRFVW